MPAPPPPAPDPAPRLRDLQYGFTAHIRDPGNAPRPADVEDRRMAIYRDLFYHNVEGFLANGFPVLRALLEDDRWHAMARDFFARHRSKSPYFKEIGKEFLTYLESERDHPDDPPFLWELAHYEWVEMAVGTGEYDHDPHRPGPRQADPDGDPATGIPVLAPFAWLLHYRYPVQRIGPEQPSPEPEATYLVVYRTHEDEVAFLALNPVTMRLLELIRQASEASGEALLRRIADELRHPNPEVVIRGGLEILEDLRRRGVLAGTRPAP